jgi:glycosyltransferase involved in cell wall biosynthesis
MKVSIITPSLNQARFIERTIQSVLAQQWNPLEHIVVDGGSTDGTVDILRNYDDHLQWVSEPDKGQSDAVNKGIRTATGDVIGWLNSDDVYYPGAVKHAVEFFAAHPQVDAVYGMADYIADDDSIIDAYPSEPWDFPRLKDVCFVCQPALFFRQSVFKKHGYLDTDLHYCMDYEYCLRLGRAGVHFGYLEAKLAGARMYVGNKTISNTLKARAEVNDMFRRRFGTVPDSWLFGYAHAVAKKTRQPERASRALSAQHRVAVDCGGAAVEPEHLTQYDASAPARWMEETSREGTGTTRRADARTQTFVVVVTQKAPVNRRQRSQPLPSR